MAAMTGETRHHRYDISTPPSLGSWRRGVAAWLGLVLLAFNIVAGGALQARATPLTTDSDHIIVCTAAGLAVVDRNGTPVTPDHAGENGFCAYCLPFSHGAVITPVAIPLPVPFVQPIPRAPLADAEPVNVARPLRLAYPRAPPAA
jgi:hypothetical protein